FLKLIGGRGRRGPGSAGEQPDQRGEEPSESAAVGHSRSRGWDGGSRGCGLSWRGCCYTITQAAVTSGAVALLIPLRFSMNPPALTPTRHVVLCDAKGQPHGTAEIVAAHSGEGQLHLAFSVFVFRPDRSALLIQKRSRE